MCFEWYCMMKMVWNWIHTFGIMYGLMFVCVLSIDAYVVTKISEFHWWSKSHGLRYQVVRSWWGSSWTPWHMRCTTWVILNLPSSFLLDSLIIFGSYGRTYLIRVFRKASVVIMFVEYHGCVDPCGIYVIFMLGFEEDWIIEKLIHVIWFSLLINYFFY